MSYELYDDVGVEKKAALANHMNNVTAAVYSQIAHGKRKVRVNR